MCVQYAYRIVGERFRRLGKGWSQLRGGGRISIRHAKSTFIIKGAIEPHPRIACCRLGCLAQRRLRRSAAAYACVCMAYDV
jgi:hypothetical protein